MHLVCRWNVCLCCSVGDSAVAMSHICVLLGGDVAHEVSLIYDAEQNEVHSSNNPPSLSGSTHNLSGGDSAEWRLWTQHFHILPVSKQSST